MIIIIIINIAVVVLDQNASRIGENIRKTALRIENVNFSFLRYCSRLLLNYFLYTHSENNCHEIAACCYVLFAC